MASDKVVVTGSIGTTSPTDVYPTHDSITGKGGYREVATHAERNAITVERRRAGMAVYTADDGVIWVLSPTAYTGTDADWAPMIDAGDVGLIQISSGGTGATTAKAARINLGSLTGFIAVVPGDAVQTSFDIVHNRNFGLTIVTVTEIVTGQEVIPDVFVVSNNIVRVSFGAPPAANEFNCTIIGLEV